MPAKPSEAWRESEKPEKKLFVFFVDPAKDPDIFEKLSSVRPVAKYLRQVIRQDLEIYPAAGNDAPPEAPPAVDGKSKREVFWENFPLLFESSGVSVKEFADSVHVTPLTVSMWKAGKTFPRSGQIMEICRFFHISRSELLEEGFPRKSLEAHLLRSFHSLSSEGKRQLMEAAETLESLYPKNPDEPAR